MAIIIQSIAFAISILLPLSLEKESLSWLQVITVYSISLASVYSGYLSLIKLNISQTTTPFFAFSIILGFSLVSATELIFIHFLLLTPIQSFFIILTLLFGLSLFQNQSQSCHIEEESPINSATLKRMASDVSVLILISIFSTIWCREIITSVNTSHLSGIFHAWPDIFFHTSEIISLENYFSLNNQSLYLSGTYQNFYHLASYSISALYASACKELALNTATSFWTPVGVIMMGLGVYSLGATLAGRLTGLFATTAVFTLPDASMYGPKVGYFGFHWLLQTSPGAGYAIALILLSIAFYIKGVREGKLKLVLWSLPLVVLSAFFRIQLAAPALIMMGILSNFAWVPLKKWHRPVLYSVIFLAVVSTILLFETIQLAPHFISGEYNASRFFDAIHSKIASSNYGGTIYGQTYTQIIGKIPLFFNWIIGYSVFLLSALGLLFPIALILSIKRIPVSTHWKVDIIPLTAFLAGFLIIVLLPLPADGDYSNFGHRPFVLYYAISVTFVMYWVTSSLNRLKATNHSYQSVLALLILIFIALSAVIPIKYGKSIQQPKNWSNEITINKISPSLFDATEFIRIHSGASDIVLSTNLDPWANVITLTERPAFISREPLFSNFNGKLKQEFFRHKEIFETMGKITTFGELCQFARKNKIRWILRFPGDLNEWPEQVSTTYIFKSAEFYVYRTDENTCKYD